MRSLLLAAVLMGCGLQGRPGEDGGSAGGGTAGGNTAGGSTAGGNTAGGGTAGGGTAGGGTAGGGAAGQAAARFDGTSWSSQSAIAPNTVIRGLSAADDNTYFAVGVERDAGQLLRGRR